MTTPSPWLLGLNAGWGGDDPRTCPYPPFTAERAAWMLGHAQATETMAAGAPGQPEDAP